MTKERLYGGLWWGMRVYALFFAGFIAAFGAFRWRLPAYRRRYGRISQNEPSSPDEAAATGPEDDVARPSAFRSWSIAIGLILLIAAIWVVVALVA